MLTESQKKNIYDLLLANYKLETEIPLASVALYLNSKKLSYSEFGFKKMGQLIKALEFLELIVKEEDHKKLDFLVIHKCEFKNEKTKKLTEEEKKRILALLQSQFKNDEDYELSKVTTFLATKKISQKDYGYTKIKLFFKALSKDIQISQKDDKGKAIIRFETKKIKEKKVENKTIITSSFEIPKNIITAIKDLINKPLPDNKIKDTIFADYEKANKNKTIISKDSSFLFQLSFKTKDNAKLYANLKKSTGNTQYKYFINYIGTDIIKPKDTLRSSIYFSDYEKAIEDLGSFTLKEKWCYHNSYDHYVILKIYLQYTFYQITKQNKLVIDENESFAAFNTGLKNDFYEDIYCILSLNKDKSINEPYIFEGFTSAGVQGLGKVLIEHFNPLPKNATYAEKAEDLIFDIDCEIHNDDNHILLDNIDRLPLSFLANMAINFPKAKSIISNIEKEKNDNAKTRLYEKLEKEIEEDHTLFTILKYSLSAAIKLSIDIVKYDYRMALPSFFPTRNVMSFMLPLIFSKDKGIEAVLLVQKTQSGNYQGQTILTLKQSYVNARLLGRLDNTFLNADKIND